MAKQPVAECLGTFRLIFASTGAIVVDTLTGDAVCSGAVL
jgi:glycerol uptake facilitator-like aquaporin